MRFVRLTISILCRDLDLACMQAIAVLLADLPLQPDETEPNTSDTKMKIYLKYDNIYESYTFSDKVI